MKRVRIQEKMDSLGIITSYRRKLTVQFYLTKSSERGIIIKLSHGSGSQEDK